MSIILRRVEWYRASNPTVQEPGLSPLNDVVELSARKALDVQNNTFDLSLKNAHERYVNANGESRFSEDDMFKVYVKKVTDASDLEGQWWGPTNLIGTYYLKETQQQSTLNRHRVNITCVDKAYILFNKVFANSYGFTPDQYFTAPGIIKSVVQINSTTENVNQWAGTGTVAGVYFDIQTEFASAGGNIEDRRVDINTTLTSGISDSSTTINVVSTSGFVDEGTLAINGEHIYYSGKTASSFTGCVRGIDDTLPSAHSASETIYQGFPQLLFSLVWKPIYEWLSELSQPLRTNYVSEQVTQDLFFDRSFLLWVDEENRLHYKPTTDDFDITFTIGESEVYECVLDRLVFDSVNMVIYNVGNDMFGAGLNWYWYDANTRTSDLKMRYQPMTDIIEIILNDFQKFAEANSIALETEPANDTFRRFPEDSEYPISDWTFKGEANAWLTSQGRTPINTLNNDNDFNESLRAAALYAGQARAQNITNRVGSLRYRGRITTRGNYYKAGDLIRVNDSKTGVQSRLLRVTNVTQNVGRAQWSTTLDVEEDERALRQESFA